jgi:hypothetical protein
VVRTVPSGRSCDIPNCMASRVHSIRAAETSSMSSEPYHWAKTGSFMSGCIMFWTPQTSSPLVRVSTVWKHMLGSMNRSEKAMTDENDEASE